MANTSTAPLFGYRRTCDACPSQWDVHVEDGRKLYVRYRHGRFTVHPGDDITGSPLVEIHIKGGLSGFMSDFVMEHFVKGMLLHG